MQIIRYFFKHNAHVLWAFTTNQKTNPLAFSYVELTLKVLLISDIEQISLRRPLINLQVFSYL
ncbi:hypothetical protein CLI82_08540 [Porphyromonas gingivalis]|nr:hypothetical protein CLI82_08540 [Porphyromonas gingivalis]